MAISIGVAGIVEILSILLEFAVASGLAAAIFTAVTSLVDVFEEHEAEIADVLDLPTARGGVNIPLPGGNILGMRAEIAMVEAMKASEIGLQDSASSRKNGDDLSKENAKKNKEKTKNETEPRENHVEKKKGETNSSKGEPNSSSDEFYDDGSVKQRRYYDENGRPSKDIDYTDHGDPKNHEIPHEHYWGQNEGGKPIRYGS